ncbi:MAG: dNTP triphosphohydrolase, partial [Planctomycetota bacterium]
MSTPSWSQQITQTRLGRPAEAQVGRNDAQRDFDRIVFSSPFRRLQGKTQVFPLPETDTTHTRLTHSLEAACVGRSLGYLVGRQLPEVAEDARVVGDIVAAAALAHDLGNPPFGHSGESAIASFFQEAEERGAPWFEALTPVQRTELQEFEGNALGFRLLTRVGGQPGGFGLTHGTLAAFSKYPCSAARPRGEGVATKKYGVFHDDLGWFQQVAAGVGLTPLPDASDAWCRPALAFLTEAADDICYRIIDLEDGYKLRLVTYEEARAAFVEIAEQTSQNLDPLSSFRSDEE